MKLYNSYLTIQPNGTKVLLILRGIKSAVEQSFYSLFNFSATNGKLNFHRDDNINAIGITWSSWPQLSDYFYNVHYFKFSHHRNAFLNSVFNIGELKKDENQETLLTLQQKRVMFDGFNFGVVKAENPDNDIKDAIISHSFLEHKPVGANKMGLTNFEGLDKPEIKEISLLENKGKPGEANMESFSKKTILDRLAIIEL